MAALIPSLSACKSRMTRGERRFAERLESKLEADYRAEPPVDRVSLVTFHSSKGLEYRFVAIPGIGYLPNEHELEADEVRLAYVAMTRATERLIMTCHRESPFVKRLMAAGAKSA